MITNDELAQQLKGVLDDVDDGLAGRPRPTPAWDDLQRGLRHARRVRRVRRAGRAGLGAVAVAATCAGLFTGAVPYPSYAPLVTAPGAAHHSALYDGRTRGSLAGDTAWLKELRENVAGLDAEHEPSGKTWKPPSASQVSVLYAGDVGGYRIAVVEGDWHWGPVGDPSQMTYLGPAGAAASQMAESFQGDPSDPLVAQLQPNLVMGAAKGAAAAVVVVSADPVKVELVGPPDIDARARVRPVVRALAPTDGVYASPVTDPGRWTVRINGRASGDPFPSSSADQDAPAIADATPVRGGSRESGEPLSDFASATWGAAQQPVRPKEFRVVAAQSAGRSVVPGTVRAVVGVVTLPSGARVLAGGGVGAGSWVDAGKLLPAGADEKLAIAWREPAGHSANPWTGAMGPAGTARVQWLKDGETLGSTPAEHTIAAIGRGDVTAARFLDADGRVLGTEAVSPGLKNGQLAR